MTYTAKQLEPALKLAYVQHDDPDASLDDFDDYGSDWDELAEEVKNVKFDDVEYAVATKSDRINDDQWIIFIVTDSDGNARHFRKSGYYASFGGDDWDGDFEEVTPRETTVIVYDRVEKAA